MMLCRSFQEGADNNSKIISGNEIELACNLTNRWLTKRGLAHEDCSSCVSLYFVIKELSAYS